MSRSGYVEDSDNLNLYRGAVERAIRGKRGQAFLREMLAALDAMPVKEFVTDDIVQDGEHVCGLGAVALARRLDVRDLDVEDGDAVAERFGIASSLAREIAYENDECGHRETPEERWRRMRAWVKDQIVGGAPGP